MDRCAVSFQVYTIERHRSLLVQRGLKDVTSFPLLTGREDDTQARIITILATRAEYNTQPVCLGANLPYWAVKRLGPW